jgi:DNA-binding NarL/FixJ family response regulator
MPGIDGIEAAAAMFTVNPSVPLILFTVWDLEDLERAAAKAGIRAVVPKTEVWTLITSIETLFAQKLNDLIQ